MSFNLSSASVPAVYPVKAYADYRAVGAGGTIRLKRIDGETESQSQLVLASDSKSLLSDPKDLLVLEAVCYLASRPNLLSDAKSAAVKQEFIRTAEHAALLEAVLSFRKTGTMPTVVGTTGLAFAPVAPESKTATGLSAAAVLAEARGNRSGGGTSVFRRSRNIS